MGRRAKPAKTNVEAKRSLARKSPRDEGARARDLEKRLAEALNSEAEAQQRETATADILRVISNSLTDVQPVLDAVAESAARLCESSDAEIFRRDGARLLLVAHHGPIPSRTLVVPLARETFNGRTVLDGRTLHVVDLQSETDEFPRGSEIAAQHGTRAQLSVPLMREGVAIGTISLRRAEARRFTERQVALLQTFADQAVIAIENVRLFTELQDRNRAVTEALERQTATSEILSVISSSPTDVQPVLDTIVRSAAVLCAANYASVHRYDGEFVHFNAHWGLSPEAVDVLRQVFPYRPSEGGVGIARAIREARPVQIDDLKADSAWRFPEMKSVAEYRTLLMVPMLRHGVPIGAIAVGRTEVRPFKDVQVDLLKTFADQAVIAIENVRLFAELQTRTDELTRSVEQLTALGEVGRAVSSTLDLETVLTTIVSRAVELSGLDGGVVFEYDDREEAFVQRAATEQGGPLAEARRETRIQKGEGVVGRTAITLEPVQVADISAPGSYESRLRETLLASGVRAILAVPMVREDRLIGNVVVTRNRPGEFLPGTIELLRTFATQSALAIQNARLFREIEIKSRELEVASQHKSEFLASMSHELRTPLNAVIGFSEVLLEKMFGDVNDKQEEYLRDIHTSAQHLLSLINDILDLSKIEAGRMDLDVAAFDLPSAIDDALLLMRERAGRRGITLERQVDERLGEIHADQRKVKQVLLNLLSNAVKFTPEGGRIDVRASIANDVVEIAVTDTGIGIAPEDHDAVFEEFRQVGKANKKAEGTGLGLALCRKFVELHGGRIWVKSQMGAGSMFTFTLPLSR